MNARFPHPAGRGNAAPGRLHDDTIDARGPVPPGSACCCPARPVVQVVMPPIAARPHQTELLLCGHHYRVSRQALYRITCASRAAAVTGGACSAVIFVVRWRGISSAIWQA
jgi:hypothetical protein